MPANIQGARSLRHRHRKGEKTRVRGAALVTATVAFGEAVAMHAVAGEVERDRGKEARGTVTDLHVLSPLSCSTVAACRSELLDHRCRCGGCICHRYKHLCRSPVAVLLSRSHHRSCGCSDLNFFSAGECWCLHVVFEVTVVASEMVKQCGCKEKGVLTYLGFEKGPHASIGESAPASTCRGHVWHTSAKESAPVKVWNLAEVMPLECLI
ncbi:uncharacterized protein DS421_1g11580 [Arachis hypogaea]|nr:uncharacterized protein DS421_1g11580 [Arachis hypogaea]